MPPMKFKKASDGKEWGTSRGSLQTEFVQAETRAPWEIQAAIAASKLPETDKRKIAKIRAEIEKADRIPFDTRYITPPGALDGDPEKYEKLVKWHPATAFLPKKWNYPKKEARF